MNKNNFYKILSEGGKALNKNSKLIEIKKAYKRLIKTYHPDKGGDAEKCKALHEAYEVLSDPTRRKDYNSGLMENNPVITFKDAIDPDKDYSNEEYEDFEELYEHRAERFSPKIIWRTAKGLKYLTKNQPHEILSFRTLNSFSNNVDGAAWRKEKTNKIFGSKRDNNVISDFHVKNSLDDLRKYISNSRRAYRDSRQIILDFSQPLKGLKNILLSPVSLIFLLARFLIDIIYPSPLRTPYLSMFSNIFTYAFFGLIQVISTPLTWFITMPLRGIQTVKNGWEVVEEGYHMQRIIDEAYTGIEQEDKFAIIICIALLHAKFQNAINENQHCRKNDIEQESELYEDVDKDFVLGTLNAESSIPVTPEQKTHLLKYLGFFKASPIVESEPMPAPNPEVGL